MQGNKLCIYLFATVYCIITISVPNNPNHYTLAIDIFSCSLSFASCIILQTFLAKQETILGGLCIQFLCTEELAIIQYLTLGLFTNSANADLSRFYKEYPEIAKYVMNNLPVGCCICGYLFILSTARLILIYSPSYYQGLNRGTCLKLSECIYCPYSYYRSSGQSCQMFAYTLQRLQYHQYLSYKDRVWNFLLKCQ